MHSEPHIITTQMPLPDVPVAPPVEPAMPSVHTAPWLALLDMTAGPITTLDWVLERINWKLGDAIHKLEKKLGWQILSEFCTTADGRKTQKYWLTDEHLELAKRKLETTK